MGLIEENQLFFNQVLTLGSSRAKVPARVRNNKMKKLKALIAMAPGSDSDMSSSNFHLMCDVVTQRVSREFNYFDVMFIESVDTGLEECIEKALACGVEDIAVYPFFLNEGESVDKDIQDRIVALSGSHPCVHFVLLDTDGATVIDVDNPGLHSVAK